MVADVCWRCFCHGGFWARPILRDWRKHCHLSWTRRCMNLIFLICHKFEKVFVPLFSLRSKFAAHYNVDLTFPSGQGESCISDKTPSLPCMVWRKRMSARHFQFMVRWNRRCKLSFWPQFSFCNHLSGGDFDLAGQFPNLEELRGDLSVSGTQLTSFSLGLSTGEGANRKLLQSEKFLAIFGSMNCVDNNQLEILDLSALTSVDRMLIILNYKT